LLKEFHKHVFLKVRETVVEPRKKKLEARTRLIDQNRKQRQDFVNALMKLWVP